jgi:hypothetical protein
MPKPRSCDKESRQANDEQDVVGVKVIGPIDLSVYEESDYSMINILKDKGMVEIYDVHDDEYGIVKAIKFVHLT